jgi:hypothetical protein
VQDGRFGVNQVAQQVKETCVAVAINGHMLHWLAKTDGQDGEFIKSNRHPSGCNCFVLTTPSGKKLAGGNGSGGARDALAAGLKSWKLLTDDERTALPAGKQVKPPEADRCTPPPGGLILRSFTRNLKKDNRGDLAVISKEDLNDRTLYPDWNPIYMEPAHFNVWLTETEWKSLLPADPKKGDALQVPNAIQKRLFRYHLVNGTFGLPGSWSLEQIRAGKLTLAVEEVSPVLRMRLQGSALLTTDADPAKAQRGYDARLSGRLTYDPQKKILTRFDMVATGDYWGGDTRADASSGLGARRWVSPSNWQAATMRLTGCRHWCTWIGSRTTARILAQRGPVNERCNLCSTRSRGCSTTTPK